MDAVTGYYSSGTLDPDAAWRLNRAGMAEANKDSRWGNPSLWRVFFGVLLATLVLTAAFNLLVDPFDLYGTGLVEPFQFNTYRKKLDLFREFAKKEPPRALILGSSRAETLDPRIVEEITGERCFNWGLPSGRVETILASLRIAVEDEKAPIDLVVVAVDPLAFHPSLYLHPQSFLVPEYYRYFPYDRRLKTTFDKLLRLLTTEQTRASIEALEKATGLDKTPAAFGYREDGYALFYDKEAAWDAGTYDLDAELTRRVPDYPEQSFGLSNFKGLAPVRKAQWEQFLDICKNKGIRVYVFMPPVHPRLWEALSSLGAQPIFKETSDYLSRTVNAMGGTYRDFTQLDSFGGDPSQFYDEVHMRPSNTEILLRRLLQDQAPERIAEGP